MSRNNPDLTNINNNIQRGSENNRSYLERAYVYNEQQGWMDITEERRGSDLNGGNASYRSVLIRNRNDLNHENAVMLDDEPQDEDGVEGDDETNYIRQLELLENELNVRSGYDADGMFHTGHTNPSTPPAIDFVSLNDVLTTSNYNEDNDNQTVQEPNTAINHSTSLTRSNAISYRSLHRFNNTNDEIELFSTITPPTVYNNNVNVYEDNQEDCKISYLDSNYNNGIYGNEKQHQINHKKLISTLKIFFKVKNIRDLNENKDINISWIIDIDEDEAFGIHIWPYLILYNPPSKTFYSKEGALLGVTFEFLENYQSNITYLFNHLTFFDSLDENGNKIDINHNNFNKIKKHFINEPIDRISIPNLISIPTNNILNNSYNYGNNNNNNNNNNDDDEDDDDEEEEEDYITSVSDIETYGRTRVNHTNEGNQSFHYEDYSDDDDDDDEEEEEEDDDDDESDESDINIFAYGDDDEEDDEEEEEEEEEENDEDGNGQFRAAPRNIAEALSRFAYSSYVLQDNEDISEATSDGNSTDTSNRLRRVMQYYNDEFFNEDQEEEEEEDGEIEYDNDLIYYDDDLYVNNGEHEMNREEYSYDEEDEDNLVPNLSSIRTRRRNIRSEDIEEFDDDNLRDSCVDVNINHNIIEHHNPGFAEFR